LAKSLNLKLGKGLRPEITTTEGNPIAQSTVRDQIYTNVSSSPSLRGCLAFLLYMANKTARVLKGDILTVSVHSFDGQALASLHVLFMGRDTKHRLSK
jgi:hypothetical protein